MGLGIRANGKVYKRCLRKIVGQAKFSQVSEVGKGEEVLPGRDGQIRGAVVRLGTRNQQSTRIRQPVYPLEVQEATKGSDQPMNTNIGSSDQFTAPQLSTEAEDTRRRSRRIPFWSTGGGCCERYSLLHSLYHMGLQRDCH